MSFAALKDKRNARRVPLAGVTLASTSSPMSIATPTTPAPPVPVPPPSQATNVSSTEQETEKTQPSASSAYTQALPYVDFPEEILQIRTTVQSGRGIYVRPDLGKRLKAGTWAHISGPPRRFFPHLPRLSSIQSKCRLTAHPPDTAHRSPPPAFFFLGRTGTTIIATSPTEAVLSTQTLEEYCPSCFLGVHELYFITRNDGGTKVVLFACGGCRAVRYCSRVRPVVVPPTGPAVSLALTSSSSSR